MLDEDLTMAVLAGYTPQQVASYINQLLEKTGTHLVKKVTYDGHWDEHGTAHYYVVRVGEDSSHRSESSLIKHIETY